MAKYRLIKKYPNSPSLGTTVEGILLNSPEAFSEFWKKLPEKSYKILEEAPVYNVSITKHTPTKVERASDGEVFKIGDKVHITNCNTQSCKIERFYLDCNNDKMLIAPLNVGLDKITKSEPLFTTEDGVDIYEGMKCFLLDKNTFKLGEWPDFWCGNSPDELWYFYSKEKALEFIKKNRAPLFITYDGVPIYPNQGCWGVCLKTHGDSGEFEVIEKWDIMGDIGTYCKPNLDIWLTFSTEKAAKEYVDLNKPSYSILDVVGILKRFEQDEYNVHSPDDVYLEYIY